MNKTIDPRRTKSLAKVCSEGPLARFEQEHRSGGSMPVRMVRLLLSSHDQIDPPVRELSLQIALKANMRFRWNLGDGWSRTTNVRDGFSLLAPAHTEIAYECGGEAEVLIVAIPEREMSGVLAENEGLTLSALDAISHLGCIHDARLISNARGLWHEALRPDPASDLLIDGLVRVLVAQLLRKAGVTPSMASERLSDAMLRRLIDYIEGHLADRIVVKELANVSGLSPFYFSRSFRQTVGMSPYQFVIERRLARAQALLSDTRLTLVEVALACGFASQAHMTDTFRARTGVSPGRFRSIARGGGS
ncbi:MAG: AraC family transcriptional regulator [Acidobacteriota bacterium]